MNTREIINYGKSGTLAATELTILANGNPLKTLYANLMAIFLKQGTMFDRLYIQVQGDSISIAIHGINGNIFFMKLNDFFLDKKNKKVKKEFPINGDFLLEGVSDHNKLNAIVKKITPTTSGRSTDNPNYMMAVSPRRSRSYNYSIVTGDNTVAYRSGDLKINLGISSLSLPIVWSPIKGSLGNLKGLVTRTRNPDVSNTNQQNLATVSSRYITNSKRKTDIPPIIHIELRQRTTQSYGYGGLEVNGVDVLCSQDTSIVKDALPNELDISNLAFLYELPRGTISSIIGKGNKKRPFGNLRVYYDTNDEKLKVTCRTVNETVSDGELKETTVESARLEDKGELLYADAYYNATGVANITYATWFDIVQTARSGTSSFSNFSRYFTVDGREEEIKELFGVSKNGDIVYGLKGETSGNVALVTISMLGKPITFDAEMLKVIEPVVKKRTTKKAVKITYDDKYVQAVAELAEKPRLLKRLLILHTKLNISELYKKWKKVSDAACEETNQPKEYGLSEVFYLYLNSEETVTIEDIEEFNRLKK